MGFEKNKGSSNVRPKRKRKRYNDLSRATSNTCDTLDRSRSLIVETGNEEHETNNVDTDKEITVKFKI